MSAINQRYIQDYWFGEKTLKNVLDSYGIDAGTPSYDMTSSILQKSKNDFVRGSSIIFKEDVDRKILSIVNLHKTV